MHGQFHQNPFLSWNRKLQKNSNSQIIHDINQVSNQQALNKQIRMHNTCTIFAPTWAAKWGSLTTAHDGIVRWQVQGDTICHWQRTWLQDWTDTGENQHSPGYEMDVDNWKRFWIRQYERKTDGRKQASRQWRNRTDTMTTLSKLTECPRIEQNSTRPHTVIQRENDSGARLDQRSAAAASKKNQETYGP